MTEEQNAGGLPSEAPVRERAARLVSQMTLDEKVSQMVHDAVAIERLGIPAYNWWNECLHGVARAGVATVFPQAIALAATFDLDLMHRVATAISDEARAKHHDFVRRGLRVMYGGLTFWSPNVNIFRDPRWGRGQETYGEDPYLTSRMGVTFVRGLQGDDPEHLKLVATPKHFAAHSGPEPERHRFDAVVSERDLRETYLPAFEACVREAGALSVMGAYNRTNGEACCASPTLLQRILRDEWGFGGYVVSDCWAIGDIFRNHHLVDTVDQAAALAVRNGCDLNCGEAYLALLAAVEQGLLTEEEIDRSAGRLMAARIRLGMFDPPEADPHAGISPEVINSAEHIALAREAAVKSVVLLKNDKVGKQRLLPLSRSLRTIAVIGPTADSEEVLLGNYSGTPAHAVTVVEGLRAKLEPRATVRHEPGCGFAEGWPNLYPGAGLGAVLGVQLAAGGRGAERVAGCVLRQCVLRRRARARTDRPRARLPVARRASAAVPRHAAVLGALDGRPAAARHRALPAGFPRLRPLHGVAGRPGDHAGRQRASPGAADARRGPGGRAQIPPPHRLCLFAAPSPCPTPLGHARPDPGRARKGARVRGGCRRHHRVHGSVACARRRGDAGQRDRLRPGGPHGHRPAAAAAGAAWRPCTGCTSRWSCCC